MTNHICNCYIGTFTKLSELFVYDHFSRLDTIIFEGFFPTLMILWNQWFSKSNMAIMTMPITHNHYDRTCLLCYCNIYWAASKMQVLRQLRDYPTQLFSLTRKKNIFHSKDVFCSESLFKYGISGHNISWYCLHSHFCNICRTLLLHLLQSDFSDTGSTCLLPESGKTYRKP